MRAARTEAGTTAAEQMEGAPEGAALVATAAPSAGTGASGLPAPAGAAAASVSALERVLSANEAYQSFLRAQMVELERLLALNADKRRLVHQIRVHLDAGQQPQSSPAISRKALFQAPFFVDKGDAAQAQQENLPRQEYGSREIVAPAARLQEPPPNPDAVRKARIRGSMPLMHKQHLWTHNERSQLKVAIVHLNQFAIMQSALNQAEALLKQGQGQGQGGGEAAAAAGRKLVSDANERIKSLELDDCELSSDAIDWSLVSSKYVRTRTAVECRIHWSNVLDPAINHADWTPDETKRLKQIAEQQHERNWVQIAQKLGSNRTAMQCFSTWQRAFNPKLKERQWSKEDTARLKELVASFGEKDWHGIACQLRGRTWRQCMVRYHGSAKEDIKIGRWSTEEDLRLRLAVKAYEGQERMQPPSMAQQAAKEAAAAAAAVAGEDGAAGEGGKTSKGSGLWSKVCLHVPNRTDTQCRERWCNVLDPSVNHKQWTPQEDQQLREVVMRDEATAATGSGRSSGIKWTRVAAEMPGRTDNQCSRRWKQLAETKPKSAAARAPRRQEAPVVKAAPVAIAAVAAAPSLAPAPFATATAAAAAATMPSLVDSVMLANAAAAAAAPSMMQHAVQLQAMQMFAAYMQLAATSASQPVLTTAMPPAVAAAAANAQGQLPLTTAVLPSSSYSSNSNRIQISQIVATQEAQQKQRRRQQPERQQQQQQQPGQEQRQTPPLPTSVAATHAAAASHLLASPAAGHTRQMHHLQAPPDSPLRFGLTAPHSPPLSALASPAPTRARGSRRIVDEQGSLHLQHDAHGTHVPEQMLHSPAHGAQADPAAPDDDDDDDFALQGGAHFQDEQSRHAAAHLHLHHHAAAAAAAAHEGQLDESAMPQMPYGGYGEPHDGHAQFDGAPFAQHTYMDPTQEHYEQHQAAAVAAYRQQQEHEPQAAAAAVAVTGKAPKRRVAQSASPRKRGKRASKQQE